MSIRRPPRNTTFKFNGTGTLEFTVITQCSDPRFYSPPKVSGRCSMPRTFTKWKRNSRVQKLPPPPPSSEHFRHLGSPASNPMSFHQPSIYQASADYSPTVYKTYPFVDDGLEWNDRKELDQPSEPTCPFHAQHQSLTHALSPLPALFVSDV